MDRGILLLGRTGSTNRPRPLPVCLSTPPSRSALRGADSQTASASAAGRSLHSVNKRVWQLCGRAREGGGVVADLFGSAVVQMVERPWGITAFGAASVKAVPDLIRVRFKIVRVEQAPATAFEAARVRVGAILHVEDVDPEQPGTSRYRSHAEAAATTAQDLAPGHIVVSAAVIIGYALARPLSSCIATSKKTPAMTITCTIQAGPSRYCWRPSRGTTWVLACAGTNCWRCRGLEPSRGQRSPRRGRCCCSYRSWPTPTYPPMLWTSSPEHS